MKKLIVSIIAFYCLSINAAPDLLSGLRVYYKFNETSGNALDVLGVNNGTVSASTTITQGKIGWAYLFDSNTDYINLASPITQKTGSYSFWFKTTGLTDDLNILASNGYQSRIYIGVTNNNLKLETNTNGQEYIFAPTFTQGTWYHVVLARNNDALTFYLNGDSISTSTFGSSSDLTINSIGYNGRSFRGTIDEVGIWNRRITTEEVEALYNTGAGLSYPFGGAAAVASVYIFQQTVSVAKGSTVSISCAVSPSNASDKTVTWTSGNAGIATVVNTSETTATITGVNTGNANIIVTTTDGSKKDTCVVTVTAANAPVSRNYFNFYLENDFENNPTGAYTSTQYNGDDWNGNWWWGDVSRATTTIDADTKYNKVMRWYYPSDVFSDENSGFKAQIFTKPIQSNPAPPFNGYDELYFSYDIKFNAGFDWVLGGKIPGVIGNYLPENTMPQYGSGFSARPMWKQNGQLVSYIYHQDQIGIFGDSEYWTRNMASGVFIIDYNKWYNITMRVVMNSINNATQMGNNDGLVEFWVDDTLRFQRTGIRWRNVESIHIDRWYVISFFGGGTQDWAANRNEFVWTDNYVSWTYQDWVSNVPHGRVASSITTPLIHPYHSIIPPIINPYYRYKPIYIDAQNKGAIIHNKRIYTLP